MENGGFITYTAAHHQRVIQTFSFTFVEFAHCHQLMFTASAHSVNYSTHLELDGDFNESSKSVKCSFPSHIQLPLRHFIKKLFNIMKSH